MNIHIHIDKILQFLNVHRPPLLQNLEFPNFNLKTEETYQQTYKLLKPLRNEQGGRGLKMVLYLTSNRLLKKLAYIHSNPLKS